MYELISTSPLEFSPGGKQIKREIAQPSPGYARRGPLDSARAHIGLPCR